MANLSALLTNGMQPHPIGLPRLASTRCSTAYAPLTVLFDAVTALGGGERERRKKKEKKKKHGY